MSETKIPISLDDLTVHQLSPEEAAEVLASNRTTQVQTFLREHLRRLSYDAVHLQGLKLGPLASRNQAVNLASRLSKVTKELGWGTKTPTPRGSRVVSIRTQILEKEDGWWIHIVRIAE